MLRTLAFIAVREQQHEPVGAQPLQFARRDELVDDDLGAVGEVTELRLPQHQGARVGDRIAIFEAKHPEFGERAVANFEAAGAIAAGLGERHVAVAGPLVAPDRVPLAERAAAAVLTGEADLIAFPDQAAEGDRLGRGPIEALAAGEHLRLGVEDALQGLVDLEAFGDPGEHPAELGQRFRLDAGDDVAAVGDRLVGLAEAFPAPAEPVRLVRQIGFGGVELLFEPCDEAARPLLAQPRRSRLPASGGGVDLADRRVLADLGVHERLGEARLVALIVAEAAVAPHVDDDVALEALAVVDRQLAGEGHRFGIVAVDVEDRRLDALGHVRRVRRGAGEARDVVKPIWLLITKWIAPPVP
jgi:hypothetical protein